MANYSLCSDGTKVTDATSQARYTKALREKHQCNGRPTCQGCQNAHAEHNDHTIAKARCKVIHKTELIWDPENLADSCNVCHREWESFKSGNWILHKNAEQRLQYLKEHDPEGFQHRIELTKLALENDPTAKQKQECLGTIE